MDEFLKRKAGRPVGTIKNPVNHSHPMYRCWVDMKQRCLNPNNVKWKWYGGRGIVVCARWMEFKNFYEDMGDSNGLTLERKDNDGDYEPSNCVWTTRQEQVKNRRSTKGQVRNPNSLRQKAIRAGLPYMVVVNRIQILGWSEKAALEVPKMKQGAPFGSHNHRGKELKKHLTKAAIELLNHPQPTEQKNDGSYD